MIEVLLMVGGLCVGCCLFVLAVLFADEPDERAPW